MSDKLTLEDIQRLEPELVRRWKLLSPEEQSQHILSGSALYGAVQLCNKSLERIIRSFEKK
jgi:hypothetical protein